ncbi:MAG: 50S ribosomal protein L11 methyltransferase [Gammaproteobacteria bacterium]|jgi:ribosomal protein L11 methyltransferase|nr:50S ribosomal protein L11 methyltransferase [Gammaproteobacteria bacterium]
MNWLRAHIVLERIDPSPVEQALVNLGAISINFCDAADDPILEPAPGTTPLWPTLCISALFDAAIDDTAIQLAVASAIKAAPMPTISFEEVADQDWIENWKQTLQPMHFGPNLWICPTGSTCPEPGGTVIELDPGLAFGTGSHPTTALCLDWLANSDNYAGTVLDYGCGSGILSIAALVLGAKQVLGVDLDEQALRATRDNASRNHVAERLDVVRPEAASKALKFDRIVANILSGTLIELATELKSFCHTGTRIALSGILTDQTETVTKAYEPWVEFELPINRGDWSLLSGTVIAT